MKFTLRFAASTALFMAFCCVSGLAHASEMMTEAEMLVAIPGATLSGISNDDLETRWVQTYAPGDRQGEATGVFGNRTYQSKWRVGRGLWCEDWGSGSGCWRLERIDGETLQPYHGRRKLPNVWKIVKRAPVPAVSQ